MGYEPEDLPWEVPLIELGLDSLMAVRIKNRVEYDFDLPPIQLPAVRDANLYAVEKLIEYAIEHRDEVQQLHEHQKTLTRRGDRQGAGRAAQRRHDADSAARTPHRIRRRSRETQAGRRRPRTCRFRRRRPIRPARRARPTNGAEAWPRPPRGAQPGGGRQGAELRRAAA